MPGEEVNAFLTRQDIEAAVYRDRNNGQLQFICKLESASAELRHMSCKGSRTFGKDHKRDAMLQDGSALLVCLMNGFRPTFVNKDVARTLASFSYERDVPQRLLHHPFEVPTEVAVNKEDVVGALVVCHEDV